MPCPLFLPGPERCAASPEGTLETRLVETCCRRGYARVQCERARSHRADAVQFLIKSGSSDFVEVAWSMERDHLPVAVGAANGLAPDTGDETLNSQLRACADEFLHERLREKAKRL